jgi:drug/metabolite transporter (DMT)-like permease
MVILGVMAATDTLIRNAGPLGRDPRSFYIVPLTDMVVFATLIFFAFRARSKPAEHKRLILVATIGLSIAAIARWPLVHRSPGEAALLSYVFLIFMVAYDLWSMHRVHRATIWAGALLIVVQQVRPFVGHSAGWHSFAGRVQSLAR